jgi:NAD/NADP transhydrogenase alpha subunit
MARFNLGTWSILSVVALPTPDTKPKRSSVVSVRRGLSSLGAKFIAVEDEEFKQAETAAGYAKEMSDEYKKKQAALVAEHVKNQDIVITTALIPGRPAPKLLSKAMTRNSRNPTWPMSSAPTT